MPHKQNSQTADWTEALCDAVATDDVQHVGNVFGHLVLQDCERISVRAKRFIEQFAPSYFADEDLDRDRLEAHLRMDVFGASVLAYLEVQDVAIELSVEHDIATWIEANAPALVSANLSQMEQALGQPGVGTHRDQVKLHQLIDLDIYEAIQQRILEKTWADIEVALADVMAAAAS
ncbi:hypothetical protein U5801_18960 [Lamprobacter modestohalophilus]|uniref:hypothetical protein n=1 Tax=Lamprobacter modestohalophilus TaxID=1064514 RepID=UPI002ADEE168|nr:hypothetical protein [Lamprobacter modestohalophilus]MEA1051869.1 hypothetical protein [Lamprobacter modestohalophilus]